MIKTLSGVVLIWLILLLAGCSISESKVDLVVSNVQIFDSKSNKVLSNKSILVLADTIYAIYDSDKKVLADNIINGENKLVTPGFIDTHIHLTDIVGNYDKAPKYIHPDSILVYRNRLADEYLSYGVTTIRDAGSPERWLEATLEWQNNPQPNLPNLLSSGAALISDEEREPYISHAEVMDPLDAEKKVVQYYNRGIRHIKLYWRLRLPELTSAHNKAKSLGMISFAHIDFNVVNIRDAMRIGVRHYEHLYTPFMSVFKFSKHGNDFNKLYNNLFPNRNFWTQTLAIMAYVDANSELKKELNLLTEEMAESGATLSTTIHLFGSIVNRTGHRTFMQQPSGNVEELFSFSGGQLEVLNQGFDSLMEFCKSAHDKGVKLRIGTDCTEGGKAILSEMLLLHEAGFSMGDILQIATINGAESINQDEKYGSIDVGKKADMIIFEENPFDNYRNLLSEKIIIKEGIIFNE